MLYINVPICVVQIFPPYYLQFLFALSYFFIRIPRSSFLHCPVIDSSYQRCITIYICTTIYSSIIICSCITIYISITIYSYVTKNVVFIRQLQPTYKGFNFGPLSCLIGECRRCRPEDNSERSFTITVITRGSPAP